MTKIYRYCFNNGETAIIDFLYQQNITCEKTEIMTTFELSESNIHFHSVYEYLLRHNIEPISIEVSFSRKEIEEAEWLSVRSTWRLGYPQPQHDMQYRNTTYDSSDFCEECGNGLVQRDNFIFKKEPNWGTRNFFMTNWVHDELFISEKAVSILQDSGVSGFFYNDVLNPSRRIMGKVKQIYIKNYLSKGLQYNSIKKEILCPKCNSKKFILSPEFIEYDKKVFSNVEFDILKTKEKFGEITCISLIIITQKLYKTLCEHKLDRGLVFTPIKLI